MGETPMDAVLSPLSRLRAIREKAFFAQVQNTLGEECVIAAEGMPIPAREAKLGQADMHFEAFHQTVDQLVALICGDEEAVAQLDMIELHCGVLTSAGEG